MNGILQILFPIIGAYLALGLLFAIAFVSKGVTKIDPTARSGASIGFRILIFPGAVVFWPLLAKRWFGGMTEPPSEKSAHRCRGCMKGPAS